MMEYGEGMCPKKYKAIKETLVYLGLELTRANVDYFNHFKYLELCRFWVVVRDKRGHSDRQIGIRYGIPKSTVWTMKERAKRIICRNDGQ